MSFVASSQVSWSVGRGCLSCQQKTLLATTSARQAERMSVLAGERVWHMIGPLMGSSDLRVWNS